MIEIPLNTDRLLLREFRSNDLNDLARILLNPNNSKYTSSVCSSFNDVHLTLTKWMSWIQEVPRTNYKFAVTLKSDGKLIGEAALYRRGHAYSIGNIGWTIDEPFWNQGYATELGQFLVYLGMNCFKQHRIWADCHSENAASKRVLEKIGMMNEGTLRKNAFRNGQWTDSHMFSVIS